jgi:putative heme-binding domain-containing protein
MRHQQVLISLVLIALSWPLTLPALAQRNLKDIPDTDPAVELASFKVAEGFEVNLFVSDPDIAKPIQMNFDAQGRLWIASSEVYPHIKPGQSATDKILVVEDRDRDGRADKTTVFVDNLLIPTGVVPGDGGAYVVNSTELVHFEDTDNDLKADIRRVVLSGFGSEDTHHLLHTLRWGPDGALYMNQSIYIHSHVETPHGVRRLLGGGIWKFRPDSMELEIVCRGFVNPWGHHFDYWGQSFATDGAYGEGINYVFPGAVYVTAPGLTRRLEGLNPGSPKHCGLEVLSGRHLPESWRGTMVTNDFRAHRVCRFTVSEQAAGYSSRQEAEVITSSHGAFRPIDVKMGPDGAIYVADWYNPIIQHGEVDFRDDRRDHAHGRIWRISATGRDPTPRIDPRQLPIAKLLDLLTLPEDWIRLQAKLELKHRDANKVETTIDRWLNQLDPGDPSYTHNRLEAMWAMQAIGRLPESLALDLCQSSDHRARAAACRVVSDNSQHIDLSLTVLARAVRDPHPRVRLEAVRGLARFKSFRAAELVATALDQPVDRFLDFAIWQSLRDLEPYWYPAFTSGDFTFRGNTEHIVYAIRAIESPDAGKLLVGLLSDGSLQASRKYELMRIVGDLGTATDIGVVLGKLAAELKHTDSSDLVFATMATICEATRNRKLVPPNAGLLTESWLSSGDGRVEAIALRAIGYWNLAQGETMLLAIVAEGGESPRLIAAIDGVGFSKNEDAAIALVDMSRASTSPDVLSAVSDSLARNHLDLASEYVVDTLVRLGEGTDVEEIVRPVLGRKGGAALLMKSLKGSELSSAVAKRCVRVALAMPTPSPELIESFRQAGKLADAGWKLTPDLKAELLAKIRQDGDANLGEIIYRRKTLQCMNCHSIAGAGGRVGPDLVSIGASAPDDYLLESIIEPNKKVKENFHSTIILDADGQVLSGIIIRENMNEVVIRDQQDKLLTIAKSDIEERREGRSLMPDGGVDALTKSELVHLVRFLSELGEPGKFAVGTRDLARRWQYLRATPEAQLRLRRTSYDSVVQEDPAYQWESAYAQVDGLLPLDAGEAIPRFPDQAAVVFVRCELQVVRKGAIQFKVNDPAGLTLWIEKQPIQPRSVFSATLAEGPHWITIAIDTTVRRQAIRLELVAPTTDSGLAQWVTGK